MGTPSMCAFVRRKNGIPVRVAILGGSFYEDKPLLKTDRDVKACAVEYAGDTARITVTEPCIIEIAPPQPIRTVFVNGRKTEVTRIGAKLRVKGTASK